MSIILDGTNGISDVDGSASTPAIRGTDANTGIFFPAADTIAFAEGGTESMRLDSSGNVGLGTTTPSYRLDIVSGDTTASLGYAVRVRANTTAAASSIQFTNNAASAENGIISVDTSNNMRFSTGSTERMRIDPNGNVMLGTTIPSGKFTILQPTAGNWASISNLSSTSGQALGDLVQITQRAPNDSSSIFQWYTDISAVRCFIYSNGGIANFQANNANLSDRREKTNFAPAGEYLSKICSIPVQTFNYIDQSENDPGKTLGVVAQDVQAVAPELVDESNWANPGDEPKMRLSIYQTDLQFALMKCIQELKAELDAAKARIAVLEAK